jgi:hypothetical protein
MIKKNFILEVRPEYSSDLFKGFHRGVQGV